MLRTICMKKALLLLYVIQCNIMLPQYTSSKNRKYLANLLHKINITFRKLLNLMA